MSQAAAQAAAFFKETARGRVVWTLRGPKGFPTVRTPEGYAIPVWSSRTRAEAIAASGPAYSGYEALAIPWEDFRDKWLPDFAREGLRVGVNWSGAKAIGYDFDPPTIQSRIEAQFPAEAN